MVKKSNVRGLLNIRLTVPDNLSLVLSVLSNESVGQAIRESIRSAILPAKAALKSMLRADLIVSDQSTGATERAVDTKYGRGKVNPNTFYGIVGVNRTHIEFHSTREVEGQKTKLKKGSQRGVGLFAVQTRFSKRNKTKTMKSKQVFSRYRNAIGLRSRKPIKRQPSKYFHLISNGFNHFSGKRAKSYDFISRLKAQLGNTVQKTFVSRLNQLILPVMQREINKKVVELNKRAAYVQ